MSKPIPCPFCGDSDHIVIQHVEGTVLHPAYFLHCDNCGAVGPTTDKGDHVERWNTRALAGQCENEATVTINGTLLTEVEAMTLRCAVSSFLMSMQELDALGSDSHGRFMRHAYLQHGRPLERMLVMSAMKQSKPKGSA